MSLATALQQLEVPRHVAIIMDGNGRWARARGLARTLGHRRGAEAVKRTIEAAVELGIAYVTLFGFSSENWRRPAHEINDLMGLLRRYLESEAETLKRKDIAVRFVGDLSKLPADIVAEMTKVEKLTAAGRTLNLTIALSYGGRQEIVGAVKRLGDRILKGEIKPEEIDEELFEKELLTLGLPDPDLLIRTSGEKRISNFLLWQSAYSEFIFMDKFWPDFSKEDLVSAVAEYQKRDRRYGATAQSN
ncbi:MAG: isoprenyl transferase [Kiloniellales bacterium]|nr:isoprenyl transferase [Kiloniellales bacterium]